MAVERRGHGILLVVMVVVVVVVGIGSQEVEGLFECMKGCPSRCQKEFHESLFVCTIFCGMRCTCTGGAGNCSVLGNKSKARNGENQDLQLLEAAKAKAKAAGSGAGAGAGPASPVSTGQSSPKREILN